MKKDIVRIMSAALCSLGVSPLPDIDIEVPKVESFGDISTPAAMGLAKQLKRPPKKIAEEIIGAIKDREIFEKIEIAGPGFINFTFTGAYIRALLKDLLTVLCR
jgi:arginyl-tRNA synthetase